MLPHFPGWSKIAELSVTEQFYEQLLRDKFVSLQHATDMFVYEILSIGKQTPLVSHELLFRHSFHPEVIRRQQRSRLHADVEYQSHHIVQFTGAE